MSAPPPHYAAVRLCPYQPCRAVPNVTSYLRNPGDTVPTLPLIDAHALDAEYRLGGEQCPASLMRLPLDDHARYILARDHATYLKRVAARQPEPDADQAPVGIPEHSLTPHPTENAQWFATGAERKSRAMSNAGEIKAQIGLANMAMAEAQELALQASAKATEAREILAGVIGHVSVPLGLAACAATIEDLIVVHTNLAAGIQENSLFAAGL